ncbi:uncharacterized protein NPIL_685531 [Nephila pilipes]|uniref:Uncharacterized protein n=1 Tax=Nephila pilipes TaxID=299642 RepID=A0A8X6PEF9_NEPPI|nr:uncharacterized protein NPIL_685531 [Nephila pilipes]
MKDILMKIIFILLIVIIADSVSQSSVSKFAIPLKSRSQNGYLKWLRKDSNPLRLPKVAHVIKRAMRDLRIPFRSNSRPAETRPLRQSSQHGQSPVRVFSHPKLQSVPLSEVQTQRQQRYYPAFSTNLDSPRQSTRSYFNQQDQLRSQRGPMRSPSKDNMPRQHMYTSQAASGVTPQRVPFRQTSAASIPVPSKHANPSENRFSPSTNRKVVNPALIKGQPTRNRIIDVYHHIPVTQRPNHNIYSNVPIIHSSQPTFRPHNSAPGLHFPSYSERPISPGYSPEPVLHKINQPKYPQTQPGVVPQRFPGSEYANSNIFQPQLSSESHRNMNINKRLPVIPPPNINFDKGSPLVRNNPINNANTFPQNIPKTNPEIISHYHDLNEEDEDHSDSQDTEDFPLQKGSSKENIPLKDLVANDELRVVHTIEENPLNKSGAVKKYWDFRQENSAVTSVQTSGVSLPDPVIVPVSILSDTVKTYQGDESIVSTSVRQNTNLEAETQKVFNDTAREIKLNASPSINEEKTLKYQNISKEFYNIDKKPEVKFESMMDLPPHFMQIETGNAEQSTKNSIPDLIQIQEMHGAEEHSSHQTGNSKSNLSSQTIQNLKFSQNIPKHSENKPINPVPKYNSNDQQNLPGKQYSDSVLLWNENIKYIPAEVFRKNSTMSTEDNYNDDLYLQDHSSSAPSLGIYARNRAQFQKFEDTTKSNEYPTDIYEESSEIEPRKYFRGPQHIISSNWTVFDEYPVTNRGYSRLISTSVPYFSSWITSATTAMPFTKHFQQDNQSMQSHRKIINALYLANKVLGRRNNTRLLYPSLSSSTEKPESKRLKFTYSPLPRTSSESILDTSNRNSSKKIFDFRTGSTHNEPKSTMSTDLSSTSNVPRSEEISVMDESKDISSSFPQSNKKFGINITPNPNRALERINARRNQSITAKGDKRLYYINLKPVTRPYSSSVTTPPIASSTEEYTTVGFDQANSEVYKTLQFHTVSPQEKKTTQFLKVNPEEYKTTQPSTQSKDTSFYFTESTKRKFVATTPLSTNAPELPLYTEGYPKTVISTSYERDMPSSVQVLTTASEDETSTKSNTERLTTEFSTEPIISITLNGYSNKTETTEVVTETEKPFATELYTSAYPSNNNRSYELTTQTMDKEQIFIDSLKSTKIKMQDMMTKGLRHLMPMVMGLSSDVSISSDCTFSLLRWLRGIRALEQWAVKSSFYALHAFWLPNRVSKQKPVRPFIDILSHKRMC